jgi:hypothetical protein
MVSAKRAKNAILTLLLTFLGFLVASAQPAWAQDCGSLSGTIVNTTGDTVTDAAGTIRIEENGAVCNSETDFPEHPATFPRLDSSDSGQTSPGAQQNGSAAQSNFSSNQSRQKRSLYGTWRRMADCGEASEPDWLSPLATTSGRIKNELRYDIWRQSTPTGNTVSTFAGGKGLEFIAAPRVQILLGIPSYIEHSSSASPNGFGDMPLMLKFRFASANVSEGNYLVTFLLSATAPTAPRPNGAGAAVLTPTLALGKGWKRFDTQTTIGVNLPTADTQRLGRQILWNTTFQYRAGWKLWPELEVNSTFFEQGSSAGETQTFLTPGLGFGRVRLFRGLRFSMAGGCQIAVTRFHTYNHRWMLSARFPF